MVRRKTKMYCNELKQAKVLSHESWDYLLTLFAVESGRCKKVVSVAMDMKIVKADIEEAIKRRK